MNKPADYLPVELCEKVRARIQACNNNEDELIKLMVNFAGDAFQDGFREGQTRGALKAIMMVIRERNNAVNSGAQFQQQDTGGGGGASGNGAGPSAEGGARVPSGEGSPFGEGAEQRGAEAFDRLRELTEVPEPPRTGDDKG